MRRILTLSMIAVMLSAALSAQAGLTGKWRGQTKNGSQIDLDLTATSTRLTGTLTRNGETSAIAEGKISKNTLTFKATLGDRTEAFTGDLAGEQLRVWLDRQGSENAVVLERVKN